MGWSQSLFRGLWRVLSKEEKQHVGLDQFRNRYYYILEHKNCRGQTTREKRIIEAANIKEVGYEIQDIPTEWEAWIRRARKIPPMEEILNNEKYREEMKIKSKELDEKEKLLSKESKEELLAPPVQTQIKGHVSAPSCGKEEPSEDPTSTDKTLQPGPWMPQDAKS